MDLQIKDLVDDRLCYEKIRELRWSDGVNCPHCKSPDHKRHGHHNNCEYRYRYQCKKCSKYYDDFTKLSIMETANMPEMMMAMANTKSMLIQWKAFGLYLDHGLDPIVEFRKKDSLTI